jgi:hypothetical protein
MPHSSTWRAFQATPGLGQFALLCLGVWLHAADTLVTATSRTPDLPQISAMRSRSRST